MTVRSKVMAGILTGLSLAALCTTVYLTWTSWNAEPVAGCAAGGAVDCDHVLNSRWSRWMGIPVSLFGAMVYAGLLAVSWPAARRPWSHAGSGLLLLALLAAGAATWFIAIQVFLLQSYCYYCLGVHFCGLLVAAITLLMIQDGATPRADLDQMRALLGVNATAAASTPEDSSVAVGRFHPIVATSIAAVGLTALIGGQYFVAEETMVVESFEVVAEPVTSDPDEPSAEPAPAVEQEPAPVSQEPEEDTTFESVATELDGLFDEPEQNKLAAGLASRQVFFQGLKRSIDVGDYPVVGNPNAPIMLVEMLDYTCRHCRHFHHFVSLTLERYGDQVAFAIQHVPLSTQCNPNMTKDSPEKKNACDYSKLAISVWKLAPEKFPEFHDWLMESEKPPSVISARKRAVQLAGEEILLDDALKADVGQRIAEQCDVLHQLKVGLPVLFTHRNVIKGVPTADSQWTEFLEKELGAKPGP